MKNKLIPFFLVIALYAHGQQRPQYTQYMVNQFILNPAVAGTEDFTEVKAGYRNQWLGGFQGDGPVTYYLTGHTSIGKPGISSIGSHRNQSKRWHGFGVNLYNDVTGPTRRTAGYLAYSYNLPLTNTIRISVGAFGGFQQFKVNGNKFLLTDQVDEVLNGVHRVTVPDLTVGTWLYSKRYYAGIAMHQVIGNKLNFDEINASAFPSTLTHHIFATAGHSFPLNQFTVVPSIMVIYARPAPLSLNFSAKVMYKNGLFWWGASYRNFDSVSLIVGILTLNGQMPISYSFDQSLSKLFKYNTGSHEIVVGYRLPPKRNVPCPSNFWD